MENEIEVLMPLGCSRCIFNGVSVYDAFNITEKVNNLPIDPFDSS